MTRLHIVAFFIFSGYSELQAAAALGLVGFLSLAGRPIIGAVSDSFGREITYTIGMGIAVASIILVLLFGNGQSIWPIILFAGLAGLSDGVNGLIVGAKAADTYPAHTLGSVMGMVEMGRGVGVALGPILGGLLFDLRGDYTLAFSLAIVMTLASICFIWINRIIAGGARY
jgi:MFS family permease